MPSIISAVVVTMGLVVADKPERTNKQSINTRIVYKTLRVFSLAV